MGNTQLYDTIQPWPSTYKMLGDVEPRKLASKFPGRTVGAIRADIPPRTIEPPQVHLVAPRDGQPFEELITNFDKPFVVIFFDIRTNRFRQRTYQLGQDIAIEPYQIHWLTNAHDSPLEFTAEYAPHPWLGDIDEPEFPCLTKLLDFMGEKGLLNKLA